MRRNLIIHPNIEELSDYREARVNGTLVSFAMEPQPLSRYFNDLRYTVNFTADGGIASLTTFDFFKVPVKPGWVHALSMGLIMYALPKLGPDANTIIQIQWIDASGTWFSTSSSTSISGIGVLTDENRPIVVDIAPPEARYARACLITAGALAGENFDVAVDTVMLEQLFLPDNYVSHGKKNIVSENIRGTHDKELPERGEDGREWDNYGTEPGHYMEYRDGSITIQEEHSQYGSGYASIDMGSKVTRIGGKFVFNPSTAPPWVRPPGDLSVPVPNVDEIGVVNIGAFDPRPSAANIAQGSLPDAHINIEFTRTYYSISVLTAGPSDETHIKYLAITVFPGHYDADLLLKNDGETEYEVEALVSGPYILVKLPTTDFNGNNFAFFYHPLIAALQCQWAMWEVATFVPGDTVGGWRERWADNREIDLNLPGPYFDGDSAGAEWVGQASYSPSMTLHDPYYRFRADRYDLHQSVLLSAKSILLDR